MRQLIRYLTPKRTYLQVPFHDDLNEMNLDDLNLGDFRYYQHHKPSLSDYSELTQPLILISKLTDPFMNLAIEDYIYNMMPLPHDRLMFYINSPCVVIGKNQNPWKEANLPLVTNLKIPLIRRKSGGGTVVHDLGNVNYSYMTSKANFDRFKFNQLIIDNVNKKTKFEIKLNTRGDIVTHDDLKISGSAYKLSKGKSYHHGTMLLNSNLSVLRKLLSRTEQDLGIIESKSAIASVPSKVANLGMEKDQFIDIVASGFLDNHQSCKIIEINDDLELPNEISQIAKELKSWSWTYGHTPPFTHTFHNSIKFHIEKGLLKHINTDDANFKYLKSYIETNNLEYTGSNITGYILDETLSDTIGNCIDGTV